MSLDLGAVDAGANTSRVRGKDNIGVLLTPGLISWRATIKKFGAGAASLRLRPDAFQILVSKLPADSIHSAGRSADQRLEASFIILIGVVIMNQPPRNQQGRPSEPTLWVDEPADDALEDALRADEPSLWVDEHADDVHSLLEENARLRGLLAQLSDLIRRNVVHAR